MADRESSFRIAFDGEEGTIGQFLDALKTRVKTAVSEIQKTANTLDLFTKLQDDVKKAADAFTEAASNAQKLKAQVDAIKAGGGTVGDDLAKSFKAAAKESADAEKAYSAQVKQISTLQAKLTAAGVDTANLTKEQTRLTAALKEATAAAAQQSAKDLLGFKSIGDVQPKITELTNAFNTLRASGKLSASEIGIAHQLLQQKITEVKSTVSGVTSSFANQAVAVKDFVKTNIASIVGFGAAIGTVATTLSHVTEQAREFNQGILEIGAISKLSQKELDDLAETARRLARTMGFDVVEGVRALRDIIHAGIDPDNALKVLEVSADGAKAAFTDIGTVAKLSTALINGFGVQVEDLTGVLDVLFNASKNGGPTLAELSSSLGSILPVARNLNIPIEELAAALQVLTKAGLDAPTAINDLGRVLTRLNTGDAQAKLHGLGIEVKGLVGTFQEIAKRGIPLDQLLELGLTSQKSVAAVAALADQTGKLGAAMESTAIAAGSMKRTVDALEETPVERLQKFSAAVKDIEINIGNAIGASSKYAVVVADLLNIFNNLPPKVREAVAQTQAFSTLAALAPSTVGLYASKLIDLGAALIEASTAQGRASDSIKRLTDDAVKNSTALQGSIASLKGSVDAQLNGINAQVDKTRATLGVFIADIQKLVTASTAAATQSIADLNTRAAAQIALLDRSQAAELTTAQATIDIQTKLAADRLAVIIKSQADILKAFDAEAAARLAIARRAGEDEKKVAAEIAAARVSALAPIKAALQAHYNELVALAQQHLANIQKIELQRVSINEDIEDKIRAIRTSTLSAFDQYYDHIKQIDENLAKARDALTNGNVDVAEKFTKKAIELSDTIKGSVIEDGREVVSSFESQQTALDKLTEARNLYNKVLDAKVDKEKAGAKATTDALVLARDELAKFTAEYDTIVAKAAEGIQVRLVKDEASIAQTLGDLDAALTKRDFLVIVQADLTKAKEAADSLVANLKKGLTEGTQASLDTIAANLQKVADEAPQLKLTIEPALKQVDQIRAAITEIEQIKPTLEIQSNVADVQKAIDKLKEPTESTHTIHIVTDAPGGGLPEGTNVGIPGFRSGGTVQRFARGGPVFPRMGGFKVPGYGNQDSVPRALQAGSFVIRKAAAEMYGDVAMSRLASGAIVRRFAGGGRVDSPFYGDVPAGTSLSDRNVGEIDAPTLPTDAKKRDALIRSYIFDVAYAAISDDYFYWKPSLRVMGNLLQTYNDRPSDQNQDRALQQARSIGLNLGVSHGTHIGFDVDGRKWHKSLARNLPAGLQGPLSYVYEFYQQGGGVGTDTVPALLTPGEFVVPKPVVDAVGPAFLYALNAMRFPRADVVGMGSMAPPRPPARFAEGGMVGATWANANGTGGGMGWPAPIFNLYLDATDLLSEDHVRRKVIPVLDKAIRNGGLVIPKIGKK